MDEFFRISQCKSAKEMWEVLEVTHEGTEDVRRSRKHALIQEYELFRMQSEESIADVQKSRDLSKLGTAALFGKLMKKELELKRLKEQETTERKPKGLALKATELDEIKEEKEDAEDDDTISLLTKRFSKFMRKKSRNRNQQKRSKKFERNKGRRAYISWEENDVFSTSSSSTENEESNLCFMMKDEESISDSVSDFSVDSDNYDQLLAAFKETHDEANRLAIGSKKNQCYLDSGCSKHMTGDLAKFTSLKLKAEGHKLAKILQNENGCCKKSIRSDHGGDFQNAKIERFCEKHGIAHTFSAHRTPQQNGVVER
ncbi:uncharacterized protein [Phaseolus vulgaris]|uniref:uncharacterized protein n=1 Tax=Phaseolus vulgaris TaxID=3885 RepID=UPI0035C9F628